jgi:hypothetical protein
MVVCLPSLVVPIDQSFGPNRPMEREEELKRPRFGKRKDGFRDGQSFEFTLEIRERIRGG